MEMKWWDEWRPVAAMLAVNVTLGVMNTLIKKAMDQGMSVLAIITLRHFVATVFMAPIAMCRERGNRPKLTAEIFVYLFLCAMLGATLTQYLFYVGMRYTSATFSCAFLNMTPVVTFLIALPFRLETLNVRSMAGQAKVLGTAVSVGGAMLLTFYKGAALTHMQKLRSVPTAAAPTAAVDPSGKWTVGTVVLFGASFSWCSWFLLQSRVNKKYPALYSCTAIIFSLSFLQSAAMTFATEGAVSLVAVRGKLEVITVLFAVIFARLFPLGVVGSGMGFLIMCWCVNKRGPVFPAAFCPVIQIVVAIIDFSFLHEQLHLGSVLGSVVVVFGLYVLLWGKNREAHDTNIKQSEGSQGSDGTKEQV